MMGLGALFMGLPWVGRIVGFLFSPIGKGLLIAALVLGWHAYVWNWAQSVERDRLQADTLHATIEELQRQRAAAETVARNESTRAAERAERIRELNERLVEFKARIEVPDDEDDDNGSGGTIDADERDWLLELRGGS
jgi:hypothetical protein